MSGSFNKGFPTSPFLQTSKVSIMTQCPAAPPSKRVILAPGPCFRGIRRLPVSSGVSPFWGTRQGQGILFRGNDALKKFAGDKGPICGVSAFWGARQGQEIYFRGKVGARIIMEGQQGQGGQQGQQGQGGATGARRARGARRGNRGPQALPSAGARKKRLIGR